MFKSSEILSDENGKQYHIGLTKNDISDNIILVGDPKRAKIASQMFDNIRLESLNREFHTYTGLYKNKEITVMSTGMGPGSTEIAVVELCQLKFPLSIIRCGTCGALQKNISIGDHIISTGALRLENTSSFYVEDNYPAISSYELCLCLAKSSSNNKNKFHMGITATAPGFYGAQGRKVPGFTPKDENIIEKLTNQNIKNFEMETSTLLTLSNLRGFRAASICVAIASRFENKFVDKKSLENLEKNIVKTVLDSFIILDKMDKEKGSNEYWIPKL
jgi:uridine phosphorylase